MLYFLTKKLNLFIWTWHYVNPDGCVSELFICRKYTVTFKFQLLVRIPPLKCHSYKTCSSSDLIKDPVDDMCIVINSRGVCLISLYLGL